MQKFLVLVLAILIPALSSAQTFKQPTQKQLSEWAKAVKDPMGLVVLSGFAAAQDKVELDKFIKKHIESLDVKNLYCGEVIQKYCPNKKDGLEVFRCLEPKFHGSDSLCRRYVEFFSTMYKMKEESDKDDHFRPTQEPKKGNKS